LPLRYIKTGISNRARLSGDMPGTGDVFEGIYANAQRSVALRFLRRGS